MDYYGKKYDDDDRFRYLTKYNWKYMSTKINHRNYCKAYSEHCRMLHHPFYLICIFQIQSLLE